MNIFSMDKLYYGSGAMINGIKSVTWIERYRKGGEFTIIGEATVNLQRDLAIHTLISHTETLEVMIVENHEIDDSVEGDVMLKVTGRSVDEWVMENRTIMKGPIYYGYKNVITGEAYTYDLNLVSNDAWDHVIRILRDFVKNSILNADENIPNFNAYAIVPGDDPNATVRSIPTGPLYPRVLEILSTFDGGIKVQRPNDLHRSLDFIVHNGNDLSDTVQFNWLSHDIGKARYFWSDKADRKRAYVQSEYYGGYIQVLPFSGWDMRTTHVDMSDLTEYYTGIDPVKQQWYADILVARGLQALIAAEAVSLMDAAISPLSQYNYRLNYNMGDIVFVRGNYGMEAKMRVVEYCETSDETGESGYPTLAFLVGS
jgi:hypothetical protein